MVCIKEINIKNRTYYFLNDMINIKNFDSNLLKIYKTSYKNIDINYIGYISMKDLDYVNIHSVNPLYLIFDKVDGYIEESNGNKYLIFASTDKNKKVLTKYTKLWDKTKNLIEKINGEPGEYEKGFIKIKLDSDDDLILGKILSLHNMAIVVRSVFQEDNKYYLQFFLDECYNTKELMFQKELALINQINQSNV